MLLPRLVALAGAVLALTAATPSAAARADVTPVLTSTPFGALPGQRVTHTIALAVTGGGAVDGVRVTFTTSVDLASVAAATSVGRCPTINARIVVCDLGRLSAPATVRVRGVLSASAPGALVRNLVVVSTARPDADPADDRTNNAYLLPAEVGGTPGAPVAASSQPAPAGSAGLSTGTGLVVLAGALAGALALVALPLGWLLLRRRRGAGTGDDTPTGEPVV